MPNAAPRPWRMFLPLAIVLLLALLWCTYWFIALYTATQRFAATRGDLASQGLTLRCTEEGWGGFPFHFEFSCTAPVLDWDGLVEMRSSKLLMVALAYAPWQIAALLDGPSTLTRPGLAPLEIKHQRALAAITFGETPQPSFSAEIPAVAVSSFGAADKLMAFTRPAAGGGTDVALEARNASVQLTDKPLVHIDSGTVRGTLHPDQSLTIDKLELQQKELRFWGSGKLTLDAQHRLAGQIDTETNDIQALLGIAGPQFGISASKLANLRTMLGLLGNAAKIPVIAKDGVLYLGPFQAAELKPLY